MMPTVPDAPISPDLPDLSPGLSFRRGPLLLARLVSPAFLDSHILPLLEKARGAEDWYVARRHEGPGGSYSLQIFVWPPGSGTKIHDHTSWGVFCCAVGSLSEERYERLDDGSLTDHARLRKIWRLSWKGRDGISTLLPYEGGIHRIGNPGGRLAISVHLYGPRIGEVDGRDYDPSQNYVCDRLEI